MTSQEEANELLAKWQRNRKLPPEQRLNDNMTEDDLDRDLAVIMAALNRKK